MNELSSINSNDFQVSNYLLPQASFRNFDFYILYVSDIHLLHHIDLSKEIEPQVDKIVSKMFSKPIQELIISHQCIVLFGGDISSNKNITKLFYHKIKIKFCYYFYYKRWRKEHRGTLVGSQDYVENIYSHNLEELENKYKKLVLKFGKWRDYSKKYFLMDYYEFTAHIAKCKKVPPYISDYISHELKRTEDKLSHYIENKNDIIERLNEEYSAFQMPETIPIYSILGNHELIDFTCVSDAVKYYSDFFKSENINFLHNSCAEGKNCSLFGGIGFAKYNNQYNANNLLSTTPPMTREEEIKETEDFVENYKKTLSECKPKKRPIIVLSHYPMLDWLGGIDADAMCIYFSGHTHKDDSIHTERIDIYADNQIGYENPNIKFGVCKTGIEVNPFIDYEDGVYEITLVQYLEFNRYILEFLKGYTLLEKHLENKHSKLFLVREHGFYGFFVETKENVIYICNGGKIKKIKGVNGIQEIKTHFSLMVTTYLKTLSPYRNVQNQISSELKRLGFSGRIHGCIVDFDFYNHIMINPTDGKITFYYSPFFGVVQTFPTAKQLIEQMEYRPKLFEKNFKEMQKENCLITSEREELDHGVRDFVFVDSKESIYAYSRRIQVLQRLFSSNVLREWNEELLKKIDSKMIEE